MAYKQTEIDKIFNTICENISSKGYSLRKCLLAENMPSSRTFFIWLDEDQEKVKQYACACEDRHERIADEIIEISDAIENDVIINAEGLEITNHNVIQRDRLRTDSRKWLLGKLSPKKYGDSSLLKIADNDGNSFKVNAIFTTDLLYVPTDDSTPKDS